MDIQERIRIYLAEKELQRKGVDNGAVFGREN